MYSHANALYLIILNSVDTVTAFWAITAGLMLFERGRHLIKFSLYFCNHDFLHKSELNDTPIA